MVNSNAKNRIGKLNCWQMPFARSIEKSIRFLRLACLCFLFDTCLTVLRFIVASAISRSVIVDRFLTFSYGVVLVLAIVCWCIAVRHAKCCCCGRGVRITRCNVGKMLDGNKPLCSHCRAIHNIDYAVDMAMPGKYDRRGDV